MRTLLTFVILLLLSPFVVAQKTASNAPATAIANLTSTYPGAAVKEWKQCSKNWKVEFKLKGETYFAIYTPKGEWVRTEHNIPKSALPAAVTSALQASKYASWKIDDVEEHSTPQQPRLYKLKVKTESNKVELFFAPDGTLVREEEKVKKGK